MTMDFIVKIEAQLYKQKMYLNCHTYYSLRYGTFSETELLEIGKEHGLKSLVLADINNTSGCLNFIRLSREFGIKPIVGIDFRNGNEPCFVGIAKNNDGFKELNDYLSYFLHQKQRIPSLAPAFKNVFVIYPFRISEELEIDSLLPHEFIGIAAHEIPQLRMSRLLKYQKNWSFYKRLLSELNEILTHTDCCALLITIPCLANSQNRKKHIPKKK